MVKIGLSVTDNSLEVLGGLSAGETLVIEGASSLDDGYTVNLLPSGSVVEETQGSGAKVQVPEKDKDSATKEK
jgi:hypothetical protein